MLSNCPQLILQGSLYDLQPVGAIKNQTNNKPCRNHLIRCLLNPHPTRFLSENSPP